MTTLDSAVPPVGPIGIPLPAADAPRRDDPARHVDPPAIGAAACDAPPTIVAAPAWPRVFPSL